MEVSRAKEYFSLGLITGILVRAPSVLHAGWTIELSGNLGNAVPVIRTARKEVREFKTLDAAAKVVREIGAQQFSVIAD